MSQGSAVRGAPPVVIPVTIADGAQESDVVGVPGVIVGVEIPATAEGTAYYFQASSAPDGTFARVQDSGGTDVSITATTATAQYVVMNPADTAGIVWCKLEAGTAQTGASTFNLIVRPLT